MTAYIGYGGGGKGGDEGSSAKEAPDSLRNTSYAKVLDAICEGPIVGLVDGARSFYLNETPVQNADGSYNFSGFQFEFRAGTQDQSYIPGFPEVDNEIGVSTELRADAPWTRGITNLQLSAVRVRLSVPQLSQTNNTNGNVDGYRIDYAIDVATDGGSFVNVLTEAFDGKTTTKYARSRRINLPRAVVSGWQIRVRRLTPNANSARIADVMMIDSYTEIVDAKLRYPMTALVGTVVDASQFQSVPTRAGEYDFRIVRVPSNYDPETRTYDGIWDGTFKPAWTNNPAWCLYDAALTVRYGAGSRLQESQLNKWELYKIARYCDEMVPNGKGGAEPRFTCNVYIQKQEQGYRVLQDLASIFWGICYWGGGQLMISADMPADLDYAYTAANVIGGKFTYVGSSRRTRYTTALVSWNDPTDFYRVKNEYVEDQEGIDRYGFRHMTLTAFACTSQGQAQRYGRRALAASRLLTETVTFQVGLDGAVAAPGQIISIADPNRMGRRNGGRIRAATDLRITLDKAPAIAPGDSLTVMLPTGQPEARVVAQIEGDDVTVVAPYSVAPQAMSVWSVDNADLVASLYKVLLVTQKEGLTYEITALQHEPGLYDYVDNATVIPDRPKSVVPMRYQVPVTGLALSEYDTLVAGYRSTTLVIAWNAADKASTYQVEWRRNNGEWNMLPRTGSLNIEVPGIYAGDYQARVRAFNSVDVGSIVVTTDPVALSGNAGAPPKVPWFFMDDDVFTWGDVADAELAGYVIRYHAGQNTSWGDANALHTGMLLASPYQALNKPTGGLTLMIKAVNKQGIYSDEPAVIFSAFGDALVANVVEDFDFRAMGYPGSLVGGVVVGDEIHATGTAAFYGNDAANFYAMDSNQPFYVDNFSVMTYSTVPFMPSLVATGSKLTLDLDIDGATVLLEYRVSGSEPFYGADAVPFYGADGSPFYGDSATWQSWPGSMIAQSAQYQFRFTTGTGAVEGVIRACRAVIDVPDIDEKLNDVAISALGTRLPIAKAYSVIKNVQISLQDSGSAAASVRWLDKNPSLGPLIRCFNKDNVAVAGVVDAAIQGY